MDFTGKIVWITGASSGIGMALAQGFAAEGALLVLSGRREDALRGVADALPTESLVLPFEATEFDRLPAIVAQAWDWRGGVDLLVNNAGISQRSLAIDTGMAVYRQIMEVDFFAPVALTQAVLPRMVARNSGHIAAVSSVAGKIGSPLRSGYSAAKHALIGYCDSLRAEIEQAYGIRVTTILPGSVRTQVAANALQGDGSVRGVSDENIDNGMDPAEVARQVVAGMRAGVREIVIAAGAEAMAAQLRTQNPDVLFDAMAREGARLAALRAEGGAGFRPDPRRVADAVGAG
jgi:dehydrogenase/reductase SDR family protein 7B